MSHLMSWPTRKRLSLESVHVLPQGKLDVACWGMCPGLEFVATDDLDQEFDIAAGTYRDEEKSKYTLGTKLTDAQCKVTDLPCTDPTVAAKRFQFKDTGNFRIALRMGGHVWDWMRVYVAQSAPDSIANKAVTDGALNVDIVWAAKEGFGLNTLPHTVTVARLLLEKHGLKLNVNPGTGYNASRYLPGFESGIVCTYGTGGNLEKVADSLKAKSLSRSGALTVIMANARETADASQDSGRLAGATVSQYKQVNPFVVLNLNTGSVDGATLLHEMGHAAGFCTHAKGAPAHFMSYGAMRNEITKEHVANFRNSFFWSTK
jgi:hypothetical protein